MTDPSMSDKSPPSSALRIRRERELRSWSQEDLAEKMGTTALTVSRWERGVTFPSPYYRQQLCEIFGKRPQELGFVLEDAQSSPPIQQAASASTERQEESTTSGPFAFMPSAREEVTLTLSEKIVSQTHRMHPLRRRSTLLLFGAIFLLLAVSTTTMLSVGKQAIGYLLPGLAPATTTMQAPPSLLARTYPPPNAKVVLNDPLLENTHNANWDEEGSCNFPGDGYHFTTIVKSYTFYCVAEAINVSNFVYEAQMTILKGESGGLIFRANADHSTYYYFRIDQHGYYTLEVWTGHTTQAILADGTSSDFHTGPNQPNLLAVLVNGNHMDLFVNHKHVERVINSTYSQGQIGLAASTNDAGDPVEVVFRNAKVWQL